MRKEESRGCFKRNNTLWTQDEETFCLAVLAGMFIALGGFAYTVASGQEALIRGILCNILVVLAVWMAAAARDVTSKIWACWFPIMLFVLSGYEHSIANMYFIPLGILLKTGGMANNSLHLTLGSFIMKNLLPVTIGNIIGGAVIIGGGCWCIYKHKLSA